MSLALLFHYLLLNMFRMLIHPSSGACDLFDELLHGSASASASSASACIRIPHHHKATPTHIEPEPYNSYNNSSNKSQAP